MLCNGHRPSFWGDRPILRGQASRECATPFVCNGMLPAGIGQRHIARTQKARGRRNSASEDAPGSVRVACVSASVSVRVRLFVRCADG